MHTPLPFGFWDSNDITTHMDVEHIFRGQEECEVCRLYPAESVEIIKIIGMVIKRKMSNASDKS